MMEERIEPLNSNVIDDNVIIEDHDIHEQDSVKKYSSREREINVVSANDLNSAKGTVIDSMSAKDSISKMRSSKSIKSEHSELISITNMISESENSKTKSRTFSTNVSSKQNKKSLSNTLTSKRSSSQTLRLESDISHITHDVMKYPSSNYILSDKSINRPSLKSSLHATFTKSNEIHKDVTLKSIDSSVQENICQRKKTQSVSPKSSISQISTKSETGQELKPKCIPPWAKTMRNIYGMSCSDSRENVSQTALQEKIKGLMDKHSRLMLVKRGESRRQLILKQNDCGDMGTVKMTSKNTKYYMTPLPKEDVEDVLPAGNHTSVSSTSKTLEDKELENDEMSVTKKTSRSQAKTEVSHVLKTLYNSKRSQRETEKDSHSLKNQHAICPKITPSNIRDYVNAQTLDPDAIQLHEIIKIKKVPSLDTQDGRKPSSKYIINVPKCTKGDGATVNKITVKEKRKLRFNSIEDINENVTEIIYNNSDLRRTGKGESSYKAEEHFTHDVVPLSKRGKSPTKSRALEVIAESTPVISNLIKKEERDRDKILLIQYEKKSKPCDGKSETDKPTMTSTKLLGVKQTYSEDLKEMYLYGTETDGKKKKECATKVDDVSPTLREKVNTIFQELREMTFKPCIEHEEPEFGEPQHSDGSETLQYPPKFVDTDAVSVQALPEVRSAEVQVHESMLLSPSQLELITSHPSTLLNIPEEHKEGSNLKDNIRLTDIGESTETESKTRSQLEHEKSTRPFDEERPEEVFETYLGEGSREGEHYVEGSINEEQTQPLEETEERSETVKSDVKNIEDVIQEEEEEEKNVENEITKEKQESLEKNQDSLEEEQEALTDEDTLQTKEGSVSDDELDKKYKDLEDKVEGKGEEFAVPIDEKREGDEKSEIMDATKPPYVVAGRLSEDIRSYDFDPSQQNQLRIVSSSKFFHQRDSIRKLNWTDDVLYIEKSTCPQLVKALAEIAIIQPADPISYLAHWIYKDYHNRESEEQESIYKEHLEVTKSMLSPTKDEKLVCKKLSLRRYPIKRYSSIVSSKSAPSYDSTEEAPVEESQNED